MQKKCKYCGKEFNSTKNDRRYCSDECRKKSQLEMSKKRRKGAHIKKPNAAVSESEGAAVPDIVKTAVRKEMIVVQKNIDNIEDQIKAVKTTMKELENTIEKHMQNLKTLKQYLE